MLIKIYKTHANPFEVQSYYTESVNLITDVEDVIVYQGNWQLPENAYGPNAQLYNFGPTIAFPDMEITIYEDQQTGSSKPQTVRMIDYTKNGKKYRALIELKAYVCNDQGKTIEKVELYSGSKLSSSF